MRDGLSRVLIDANADFVAQANHVPTRNTLYVTRVISLRAGLLDASRILEEAALDKYSFTRDAYLQRRQSLVFDGNPPHDNGADIDFGPTVTEQVKPDSDSAPVVVFPVTEQAPAAVTGEFDLTDRTTVAASPALPSSR